MVAMTTVDRVAMLLLDIHDNGHHGNNVTVTTITTVTIQLDSGQVVAGRYFYEQSAGSDDVIAA
jgi:hypothetical protein